MQYITTGNFKSGFTIIPNDTIEDPNLSWKAKGVLTYLAGRPPNWKVQVKNLQDTSTGGRDAIYSVLGELRRAGYIKLVDEKRKGKVPNQVWVVRVTLYADFPYPEKPDTGNQDLNKKEKTNKKDPDFSNRVAPLRRNFTLNGITNDNSHAARLVKLFLKKSTQYHFPFSQKYRLSTWKEAFKELIEEEPSSEIAQIMVGYFENWRDEWMPTAKTAVTFCKKYHDIKKALIRMQPKGNRKSRTRKAQVQLPSGEKRMVTEYIE